MDRLNLQEKASERGTASPLLRIPSSFLIVLMSGAVVLQGFLIQQRLVKSGRTVNLKVSLQDPKRRSSYVQSCSTWFLMDGFISFWGVAHSTKFAVARSTWQVADTLSVLQTEPPVRIEWGCIGGWMKADGSTGCSSHSTLILCNIRVTTLDIEKISVFRAWMLS